MHSPGPVSAAAPTKEEVAETAKWFDGLEWPDLKGKPYVEITLGQERLREDDPEAKGRADQFIDGPAVRGFLLAEDAKGFTVFDERIVRQGRRVRCSGWVAVVDWIPQVDPRWARPEYQVVSRVIDLPAAVEDALAAARRAPGKDGPPAISTSKMSRGVAIFTLARWCARAGRADLAARLDAELLTLDGPETWGNGAAGRPLRAVVENEVAAAFLWRAVWDATQDAIVPPQVGPSTRLQVAAEFARIARDFPGSPDHARAARLAEIYRKMAAEDQAHGPAIDDGKLEAMSKEQQAREWIFRLRDESESTDPRSTPVQQLVKLGFSAAPALIETLGDPRLTRRVVSSFENPGPGTILTFGDCAEHALEEISGRDFGYLEDSIPDPRYQAKAASRHRAMQVWWKGVQRIGEKAALARAVRMGGSEVREKAERLKELDPAAAVRALAAGMDASTDDERLALLHLLMDIKTPEATACLRREMQRSWIKACRVDAAWALLERGAGDVAPAMEREFRHWKPEEDGRARKTFETSQSLLNFLGECGDLSAMQTLEKGMPRLPPQYRGVAARAAVSTRGDARPVPEKVAALGERIAISALDDPRPDDGWQRVGAVMRVCDDAAQALAERWPQRYVFDGAKTNPATGGRLRTAYVERDAQIAVERNTWRTAHGLEPVPAPPLPSPEATHGEPNMVVAVHWFGGKELAGFPVKVGEPLTAETFLAGLEQMQKALFTERPGWGLAVSADRLGEKRGFVVELEWAQAGWKREEAEEYKVEYHLRVEQTVGVQVSYADGQRAFDGGKHALDGGKRALYEPAYDQDAKMAAEIGAALKSDADLPLRLQFESRLFRER